MKRKLREKRQPGTVAASGWESAGKEFSRIQQLELVLPYSFLLLCELIGLSPKTLIVDFIDHLAQGTWKNENSLQARQNLLAYFISMNYASTLLTVAQTEKMLHELGIFSHIDLTGANETLLTIHEQWREHYLQHWFFKWNNKSRNANSTISEN